MSRRVNGQNERVVERGVLDTSSVRAIVEQYILMQGVHCGVAKVVSSGDYATRSYGAGDSRIASLTLTVF